MKNGKRLGEREKTAVDIKKAGGNKRKNEYKIISISIMFF